MPRVTYEYRYTMEGWYTEAALSQGFTEVASSGNKKLTMKASLKSHNYINLLLIRLTRDDEEIYYEVYRNLSKAREAFTKLCAIHKLNHSRYNPQ